MNIIKKRAIVCFLLLLLATMFCAVPAYAASTSDADGSVAETAATAQPAAESDTGAKAYAAGIAIGLAAAGGAIAMGLAISKSVESISRQPEAEDKIRTTLMLGLVFVETAIIYALIVAILIIFVL